MGYVLLWIESLAVSLLLVALVLACTARLSNRWLRALWVAAALVPLIVYAALTAGAGFLKFRYSIAVVWFYPLVALTAAYLVGVIFLRLYGMSIAGAGDPGPKAAGWPRGKLAVALGLVFALHLMTFWNIDLAVRQQVATMRVEAGALALSVAPARLPDRDNAAICYQQAFEAMGDTNAWPEAWDEWTAWGEPDYPGVDPDDAELRAFLEKQDPALRYLRMAAWKPGCYFDRDYGRPRIDMLLPELGELRNAARLLALDARVKAAEGKAAEAIENVKAMFAMAEHTGSDPILVSMLVAIAIERMAVDTLQEVVATGPLSEADLAKVNVGAAVSYNRLLERAMRMEEAFGVSVFCDVATGQIGMANLADSGIPPWNPNVSAAYRIFLMADDVAAHRRFLREYRQLTAKPYPEARQGWKGFEEEVESRPGGVLTAMLLPALSRCAQMTTEAEARRRLTRLALAALRYRALHNRLPEQLDELAGEFIFVVPNDPFDGKPMKLKHTDRGLVLYSIGPDMVDNGGTPLAKETAPREGYRRGDVVFELPK